MPLSKHRFQGSRVLRFERLYIDKSESCDFQVIMQIA